MASTEEKIFHKIPGPDTGITTRNSFCDICARGPTAG